MRKPNRIQILRTMIDNHKSDDCLLWDGAKLWAGYGVIRSNKKDCSTHRLAYEFYIGPIPDKMFVCHKCDNPSCVNPKHLFLGTAQDNIRDMLLKNRQAKGSQNGNSKLTEEQVKSIRSKQGTLKEIASEFDVHLSLISLIKKGKIWQHIL